jgi:putative tricarboxylic transport membrane protein
MNEIVTSLIIFVASLFYYIISFQMPKDISGYPRGLLILLIIMSGYLLVKNFVEFKKSGTKPKWDIPEKSINILIGLVAFVAYIFALNVLGYIISTAVFYLVWMLVIRKDTLIKSCVSTFGLVFVIYLLFGIFLKVPLPEGIFF